MVKKFLVHMSTYDKITEILNNKELKRKKYVSLSNGFPFIPLHGDSYIIFNSEKIENKYKTMPIIYTKEYLEKNKDIMEHLLEYKSIEEVSQKLIHENRKFIRELSTKLKNNTSNDPERAQILIKMGYHNIKMIRKSPLDSILQAIQNENEIVIESPFHFDYDDIDYVIYSSRKFERYYPHPEGITNKVDYLENYYPPRIITDSPFNDFMKEKYEKFLTLRIESFSHDFFLLHHILNGLLSNPEWRSYYFFPNLDIISISTEWKNIAQNIHHITDIDIKIKVIGFIFIYFIMNKKDFFTDGYMTEMYENCNKYIDL